MNKDWLKADTEDEHESISVGGLAYDLGLLPREDKKKEEEKPSLTKATAIVLGFWAVLAGLASLLIWAIEK